MSDLVVIGFENEHTAFEMRAALARLQKEYLIDMEDVVVVTKDDKGKVKLHQAAEVEGKVRQCRGSRLGKAHRWRDQRGGAERQPALSGGIGLWRAR